MKAAARARARPSGDPPATVARVRAAVRRVPSAAWACALVGLLNAIAWSLVTPPLQVPDEAAHYAYVEHIAQTGQPAAERAPDPGREDLSPDQQRAMVELKTIAIGGTIANAGVWSPLEQRRLEHDLRAPASRRSPAYSYGATPQPPLYYALAAIPYRIASGATLLQRLALMRLLSALLGALTVLFAFLFLREALPGVPWAWTVGALGVALQPMFGAITGGVNPDAFLYATSAALFACVARAFRHGLTSRLAIATGAVAAAAVLGKLNALGLLPGVAFALVAVGLRQERTARSRALRLPALALAVAAVPVAIVMELDTAVWHRPALGLVGSNGGTLSHGTLGHQLSYLWQLYLPRLPGMRAIFPHPMTREWVLASIGSFGGLTTRFPDWVGTIALVVGALLLLLAARALAGLRRDVRGRLAEVIAYVLLASGMLVLIAAQSYALDTMFGGLGTALQARYLFPLLPLWGALLALAARGAGRRWAPVAGTLIVVLALAHELFAQLLVIGRFYA